jgi:hypothetical protein
MSCENPIILGGAGSSGSTLLITLLSRHPEIVAGPELSILNKKLFFDYTNDISSSKAKMLINHKVSSNGWVLYPKVYFNEYGFTNEEVYKLLLNSENTKSFLDSFFQEYMKDKQGSIWAEKTPSNSYCFKEIKATYPKARLIHIYRDGRDVVTSFVKRNWSPYYATMTWIYNTSLALQYHGHPDYYGLKYEDLVANPENEMKKLCDFLQLDYSEKMLISEQKEDNGINSWNNKPGGSISGSSIGKYKDFLEDFYAYVFYHSIISKSHVDLHGLKYTKASELLKFLDYEVDEEQIALFEEKNKKMDRKLNKLIRQDKIKRTRTMILKDRRLFPYPGSKF